MDIQHQQDEHWLIVVLGQCARALEVVFSFICAAVVMQWLVKIYPAMDHSLSNAGLVIGLVALLNVVLVFIHEMGHAFAAWSVGRQVHLICVGIVGFVPRTGQFLLVRKSGSVEYAGFVETSPVWPDMSNAKSIWVSLGGPLATGTIGALLFIGVLFNGQTSLLILGGFFLMDMVVNLIPMRWSGGSMSDGLRIWHSWHGNLWTPDNWAAIRLGVKDRGTDIVSDAEWVELRPLVKQPFYGGAEFRQLLFVAALEKNDTKVLDILGVLQKSAAAMRKDAS